MRLVQLTLIAAIALSIWALPAAAATDETLPPFAVGYIYTPLSSGFSVKIPVLSNLYIQPLLSVDISNSTAHTEGSYGLGLRGLMGFPLANGLYPYIGAGIGHNRTFHGSSPGISTIDEDRLGFQTFFGLELQKSFIHPAVEIGIMGLHRADNSFHIGTSINVGAYFYL
ncbi:MAG TPA: hypothetical protein VHR47_08665 [Bacillota bacterium]|nr:hypothetical protein [Bacillota bacterium]